MVFRARPPLLAGASRAAGLLNYRRDKGPPGPFRGFSAAYVSFLADQQKKYSGSYQHRNQNTDDERGNPMPTLNGLRPNAFLRCSDA